MNEFPPYQERKWLSYSSLIEASRCPRLFQLSTGMRLTPVGGPHPALLFGEAMHKALGTFHITQDFYKSLSAFETVWDESFADDKRNIDTAAKLLGQYAKQRTGPLSPFRILPPPTGPGVIQTSEHVSDLEVPFAVDLGLDVPFAGKIDGIGVDRQGEPCIIEFKTASQVGNTLTSAFKLNLQILLYAVAARTITGQNIRKAYVEILQVAKTKQDIICLPVTLMDHHLEGAIKWARYWGSFILHCEQTNNFPQDFSGCHPYSQFGMPGFACKFHDLCWVPDSRNLLSSLEVREASPFIIPTVNGE